MRVAIMARVSTQEQAQNGYSIGEQIERMRDYCKAMSWDIYDEYIDAGFSGANTDRPALKKMVRDVKNKKIDKVLVWKLDRLSRSQKDTLHLIEDVFLENGCDFVSMNENFDTSTSFGRAMIGILAVFAQLEREQIRERMLMGKEARAKDGLFPCGKSPIGYDYRNGELVINEFERMQIERIFTEYAQGKSPQRIAEDLTNSGLTHKYGTWKTDTIRAILPNKTYIGLIKHKEVYFQGRHEPIISEELFEQVQEQMLRRSENFSKQRRPGRASSYLGGLILCSQCGARYSKYTQHTSKNNTDYKYHYYKCNSRSKRTEHLIKDADCKNKTWRMDALDRIIIDEIKKLSIDEEYINTLRQDNGEDKRPHIIQEQLSTLDVQLNRLIDLYAVGNVPVDVLQEKIDRLNENRMKLEAEMDAVLSAEKDKLTKKEALMLAESFSDILDAGDFDEIRTVIGALIDVIEIDGDDITIHWRFT